MSLEISTFVFSFISIFMKGFQHKNVIHNRYKWIAITAYIMAFADVLVIGNVAKGSWHLALYVGTGAALGMLSSVWLHNRYVAPTKD